MPDRLARLRSQLKEHRLDALILTSLANIRYLFGFTGSNALAAVTAERCVLVTDRRYSEQVKHEVRQAECRIAEHDLFQPLPEALPLPGGARVGFEAAHLTFKQFTALRKLYSGVRLLATENLVEHITIEKLPEEIAHTRRACAIAAEVWQAVLPFIRPGATELDIAAEISYHCRKRGGESDAFEPIVASGWRSALPHGTASRKTLEKGELVVIDFGCTYNGFKSDVTRTVMLGEPTPRQRLMYEAVLGALQTAIQAVKPGMEAQSLDGIARNYLKSRGLDRLFVHSLGHGLGLEVHSLPRIGQRSKDRIPANAIITIEPGVYDPEAGGVRIEDDVLVTETGADLLTQIDRELIIIE